MKYFRRFIYDLIVNGFASSYFCPNSIRALIYRSKGHKVKGGIMPGVFLGSGPKGKLTLGLNSYINYNCFLDLGDDIFIGDNCAIGFGTTFINSSHTLGNHSKRAGGGNTKPIIIGDGVWIGANVIIMPGVHIGNGCVIGAGSLVITDCEPDCIYIGVPARKYKEI